MVLQNLRSNRWMNGYDSAVMMVRCDGLIMKLLAITLSERGIKMMRQVRKARTRKVAIHVIQPLRVRTMYLQSVVGKKIKKTMANLKRSRCV